MLYVYLFLSLIPLAMALMSYRIAVRWGRWKGAVAAVVTLLVSVACWPIPIHGGFLLLGEVAFDELLARREEQQEARDDFEHAQFIEARADRFADRLAPDTAPQVAPGWRSGQDRNGHTYWLDERSDLLWSEPLAMTTPEPDAILETALETCRRHPPLGHWALPSDAESFFAWRNGGEQVLPIEAGRFVSEHTDTDFQLSLPIVRIVRARTAATGQRTNGDLPWRVRCVALGPTAPRRGYLQLDIGREDWNAYQLSKLR